MNRKFRAERVWLIRWFRTHAAIFVPSVCFFIAMKFISFCSTAVSNWLCVCVHFDITHAAHSADLCWVCVWR